MTAHNQIIINYLRCNFAKPVLSPCYKLLIAQAGDYQVFTSF